MSRQIQLRRGTAAEHKNFIGAIAELTFATDTKTLHVHDGETPGGVEIARADAMDSADYVVAFQKPTETNNHIWYRKYKSGWVEQGGSYTSAGTTVTLPIIMANTNYTVTSVHTTSESSNNTQWKYLGIEKTKTSIILPPNGTAQSWMVCGMSAS